MWIECGCRAKVLTWETIRKYFLLLLFLFIFIFPFSVVYRVEADNPQRYKWHLLEKILISKIINHHVCECMCFCVCVLVCLCISHQTKYLNGLLNGILYIFQLWLLNWNYGFCGYRDFARGFGGNYDEYWFTLCQIHSLQQYRINRLNMNVFNMNHWRIRYSNTGLWKKNRIIQLVNLQSHIFYGKVAYCYIYVMLFLFFLFHFFVLFCLTIARNNNKNESLS